MINFLNKCITSLQKAFINPPEQVDCFLSWMDALWWTKNTADHCHYKAWM